jgi:hypothetical protein
MKIIAHAQHRTSITYSLCFDWPGSPGCGFAFPCNADGVVEQNGLWWARLKACRSGTVDGKPIGPAYVERDKHTYRIPAVGRCGCGRTLDLRGFTNTCDCGRDYNCVGQELAPRSQWGEETGESASDILPIL